MDHPAIICNEVIDANAKLSQKDDDETKTIPTGFNKKKATPKIQNFYIYDNFINYYSIVDSC